MIKCALIKENVVEDIAVCDENTPTQVLDSFFKSECDFWIKIDKDIPIKSIYSKNKFYPPKPFNSWVWSETKSEWFPPIKRPKTDKPVFWNEENKNWESM